MKNKINIFIVLFFFFLSLTSLKAENLTVYFVDVDKIMSDSNVGNKTLKSLEKKIKSKYDEFKKQDTALKKKEEEINKQKNILSKEELDKKILDFRLNVQKLNQERNKFDREMNQQRIVRLNKMLNHLKEILSKYAADNSISLILQKTNIIIGKSSLDITPQVMDIFNKEIKKID